MDNSLVLTVLFLALSWMSGTSDATNSSTTSNNMTTNSMTTNSMTTNNMTTNNMTTNNMTTNNMTTNSMTTNSMTTAPHIMTTNNMTMSPHSMTTNNMNTAPATAITAVATTSNTTLITNNTVIVLGTPVGRTGCGTQQICGSEPSDCDPSSSSSSCFFVSAKQRDGQNFEFSISGESSGYIAATVSADTTVGGNDTTYVCANNNGKVKFFSALLDNDKLTLTELPVNSVQGRVDGNLIQCTFVATLDLSTTRAAATSASLSLSTGTFDNTSGSLGTPDTKFRSGVVDLSGSNATISNELTTTTTTTTATPMTNTMTTPTHSMTTNTMTTPTHSMTTNTMTTPTHSMTTNTMTTTPHSMTTNTMTTPTHSMATNTMTTPTHSMTTNTMTTPTHSMTTNTMTTPTHSMTTNTMTTTPHSMTTNNMTMPPHSMTTNNMTTNNMTMPPHSMTTNNMNTAPATATTTVATTTNTTLITNTTVIVLGTPVGRTGCGTQQICGSEPSDCDPSSSSSSCFFVSAKQRDGQNFEFSISGESSGYIAATVSADTTVGGNDTTYVCANNNGKVKFFSTLLNNNKLTLTELPVNSVQGRVDGNLIQCTFVATLDLSTTRAAATSASLSLSTGTFDSTSGSLGTPDTKFRSGVVDLSVSTATISNELTTTTTTTTATPAVTAHATTFQQSLVQVLLISMGVFTMPLV